MYKRLILHANKEICCTFKSFAGGNFGYSYREDRRCISYRCMSFPCVIVKKTFQVTCGDPETEVDLILSRANIFETPKDIDDFKICPTHRSNLGTGVGWFRGFISRCRVPKPIGEFGKRVPQILHKTSGKFL